METVTSKFQYIVQGDRRAVNKSQGSLNVVNLFQLPRSRDILTAVLFLIRAEPDNGDLRVFSNPVSQDLLLEIQHNIKKVLLPNLPYLFILWAFLKIGTAYRLAAGADFAHKLIGLGQTIGPAFADFAPGLNPLDWLIGIVGAAGFRLLIYFKSKNAKKYRRDEEYGSARWSA